MGAQRGTGSSYWGLALSLEKRPEKWSYPEDKLSLRLPFKPPPGSQSSKVPMLLGPCVLGQVPFLG